MAAVLAAIVGDNKIAVPDNHSFVLPSVRETRGLRAFHARRQTDSSTTVGSLYRRGSLGVPHHADSICSEFVISISGFLPSDPLLERIISHTSPKLATPSLHVVGLNDVIVIPERSELLISVSDKEATRVERHEGGS